MQQQQKEISITMKSEGMFQSPKIQNLLKWVFVYRNINPKHICGFNSTGENMLIAFHS